MILCINFGRNSLTHAFFFLTFLLIISILAATLYSITRSIRSPHSMHLPLYWLIRLLTDFTAWSSLLQSIWFLRQIAFTKLIWHLSVSDPPAALSLDALYGVIYTIPSLTYTAKKCLISAMYVRIIRRCTCSIAQYFSYNRVYEILTLALEAADNRINSNASILEPAFNLLKDS